MRTRTKALTLAAVAAVIGGSPRAVWAQADTNPPLPNALLLVDTSGSMEYLISADASGKPQLPTCNAGNPLLQNDQNRWATLVSVLTGEVQNFTCAPIARNTPDFQSEFGLSGSKPVDWNYYIKHNRIVSNGCVMGPNQSSWPGGPNGVFDFPTNAFVGHPYGSPLGACSGFAQSGDGLLDAFVDRVRFGLMTFDNSTTAGTGVSGQQALDAPGGIDGEWSYFPGWLPGPGTPALGKPGGCNTSSVLEVGARNPAAPPWEGRAIGFGDPNGSLAQIATSNDQIQQALLAVRPYGATPIAGMMSDARYFLKTDVKVLPGQSTPFGPSTDPFVTGGCRKDFIVLLTDGAPNQDLRPSCTGSASPAGGCPWEPGGVCPTGACPYKLPEEIAYDLAHPTDGSTPIKTFVVGFAVSTVGPAGPSQVDCTKITPAGGNTFDPTGVCVNPATDAIQACCTLGRIAFNGGTTNAHFADDKDALRLALSDIFSNIAADATTRTLPTFGSAAAGSGAAGYSFYSSFQVSTGSLWNGVLERRRWQCNKDPGTGLYGVSTEADVSTSQGDRFDLNLGVPDGQHPRYVYTVVPPVGAGGVVDARQSIRGVGPGAVAEQAPNPPAPPIASDGIAVSGGSVIEADAATFVGLVSPAALQVVAPAPALSTCSSKTTTLSATACRDRVLKFDLAVSDPSTLYKRTSALGSIYHSTPTLVGRPTDFVRDESYLAFQVSQKTRATVLYTETTDGQLHAFKVGPTSSTDTDQVNTNVNNELWTFIPPGVLPGIRTLFPGVQQNLLDGVPVVRDIVLQRSKAQAQNAGTSLGSAWSTVLLSGFGAGFKGYYALDVTNPVRVAGDTTTGPKFLWQLSTDLGGSPLFGTSTTPAMATVLLQVPTGYAEVAVAILPGGDSAPSSAGLCPTKTNPSIADTNFPVRSNVGCFADDDASRSLTVVRLDTGEVIKRFAPQSPTSPLNGVLLGKTKYTNFDVPVVGVPVPYPNGPGNLSTRAFVGDREGRMWRLDMSSPNPDNWSVSLFFDAFPTSGPGGVIPSPGQPIVTPPAVSVDQVGNPIVYFSTGYQDNFSSSDTRNVLWAVTEKVDLVANKLAAQALWHVGFGETTSSGVSTNWVQGTRVTGPLSVFNGAVYFATYTPPTGSTAVCQLSDSTVWAVDYANSNTAGNFDPKPMFVSPTLGITTPVLGVVQKNQIIFGVGVTKSPPCFDTSTFSDDFVGYGSSSTYVSNGNGGDFRLVWQSSPNGKAKTGDQATQTNTVQLQPPASGVRITSWASVLE
jgi:type IV pilus assembly protein PilY1